MSIWLVYFSALPLLAVVFAAAWAVQRYALKGPHASIVDLVWSPSIALTALYLALMIDGDPVRQALVVAMAAIWGLRLGWHIWRERVVGKPEDTRYAQMRVEWGGRVQQWFFAFYQIQALAAWLLSVGFVVLMASDAPFTLADPWVVLALVVFSVGVIGESVADRQLAAFKNRPGCEGQVCREGLWAYSRHPNYFFESLVWLSYIGLGIGLASGWVTILPAAIILFFLTRLSGIPNNEAQNLRTKPGAYRRYQAEVSAFVPWFPKK